ncbi:MAG: leucine-rich repeat domain-containing protein, partial [Clostridia bacterium]|nr:leucine-rich repeat domain-containing protein [Clostridia bacterium]
IDTHALGFTFDGVSYQPIPGFTIVGKENSGAHGYAAANGFTFEVLSDPLPSGACGPALTWELSKDGILTISGSGNMDDFPEGTYAPWQPYVDGKDGFTVTSAVIGEGVASVGQGAFRECRSLTAVTLPSSLTKIGTEAFYGCSALTAVTIPDAVTVVERATFAGCSSLTAVTFGRNLTAIETEAFALSAIASAELPVGVSVVGEKAFYGCGGLTLADLPGVAVLETSAFENCGSLVSVSAGRLTAIGPSAFAECGILSSITLPETLTAIDEFAFRGCNAIGSLRLPNSLTALSPHSFSGSGLTSVIFGSGIVIIPEGAFENCPLLTDVTLSESVAAIGDRAFLDCPSLRTLLLPRYVSYIAPYSLGYTKVGESFLPHAEFTFEMLGYLPSAAKIYADGNGFRFTSLGLIDVDGGDVTESIIWSINTETGVLKLNGTGGMPDYTAFENTPWALYREYIRNIVIGSGITNVGAYAFSGCTEVATVSLSSTITSVGGYAFAGTSVKKITLPASLKAVGDGAFDGCHLLGSVTLPDGLESIGSYAFRAPNALTSLHIPEAVGFIGDCAVGYSADNALIPDFVIRGAAESVAENYAKMNGIAFRVDGFTEITDPASGASVTLSGENKKNLALSFTKSEETLPSLLLANGEYVLIYDLALRKNGETVATEGSVSVRFPIPENVNPLAVTVFCLDETGAFLPVEATVENGSFLFTHHTLGRFLLTNADLGTLYTVTIRHLYEDGSDAGEPDVFRATTGATYAVRSHIYEGFQADRSSFSGKVADADITLAFIYKKIVVTTTAPDTAPPETSIPVSTPSDKDNDRVLLIVLAVILVLAIFVSAVALVVLNAKKRNDQAKRATLAGRSRKGKDDDQFAKTMVIPDAPTREIDIRSLFADEPEEDVEAINTLLKQQKQARRKAAHTPSEKNRRTPPKKP